MSQKLKAERPDWWPENPWPDDIFPMTLEEYVEAIPDPHLRSAISGNLARWAFEVTSDMILKTLKDRGYEIE